MGRPVGALESGMRRTPLYSAPRRPTPAPEAVVAPTVPSAGTPPAPAVQAAARQRAYVAALVAVGLSAAAVAWYALPSRHALTQKDIDRAVLHTLATHDLPAPAAKAFEAIRESVVKVIGYADAAPDAAASKADASGDEREERGIGSGVVIMENGTILTNLHVVSGAKRVKVVFFDGLESDADVVGLQPQNDLAVLKARRLPDDLKPATMRSTGDLRPGDRVTAVGFPFGIGPSVTHGVVSGLKREFRSPEGQKILTNLIQFDAAANPGNSGGPLVTDDGEVVGIVTAIYNPTRERFFVGIGFAVPIENAAQAAGMPPF
jgi:serine protease DegQ